MKLMTNLYDALSTVVLTAFPFLSPLLMLVAGCLGALLYGKIKESAKAVLLRALGLLAILVGGIELWNGFFVLQTAQFETKGTVLVIFSLLIGYAFGYAFSLERSIGSLGEGMFRRFWKPGKPRKSDVIAMAKGQAVRERKICPPSAEGFLLATTLCALGSTTVFSMLDLQMSEDPIPFLLCMGFHALVFFLLSALYGSSVSLAVFPVMAVEALLFLLGTFGGDIINHNLSNQLRLIGAVLLLAAGAALGCGKRTRAARFIPAYLLPVGYAIIVAVATKLYGGA
jgi:uncharacterized membrane protein YqgA involved in biofilm formation